MILIVYHAEELKRDAVQCVEAQNRFRIALSEHQHEFDGEGADRKKVKRAFDHLVKDGVVSETERREMVQLIGQRNSIAHHLDEVTADLSIDRQIRDWADLLPRRQHDYAALDRLKAMRRLISERTRAKHYVMVMSMRGLFFEATERALRADIKGLEQRIRRLSRNRRDEITKLNGELSLQGTELVGTFDPGWPDNRYDRGRLTPRGVEVCYRLFDKGKSAMAVAHLMQLSLTSARRRERQWRALGGIGRAQRVLEDIPKARIRYRNED